MSDRCDRYNLVDRLEKAGDELMTAFERREPIENRVDACAEIAAVCRIVTTLRPFWMKDQRAEPDDDKTAGSAVDYYAKQFAAATSAARAASTAEPAGDSFSDDPCWTDPADE